MVRKSVIPIDVCCSSRKMFWFISSTVRRLFFLMAFKTCLDRSIFPTVSPDWRRPARTLSGVLFCWWSVFTCDVDVSALGFFWSWNLEFKLIWALNAYSLSQGGFVVPSLSLFKEVDAGTLAGNCSFLLIQTFAFVLLLIFQKAVLVVSY